MKKILRNWPRSKPNKTPGNNLRKRRDAGFSSIGLNRAIFKVVVVLLVPFGGVAVDAQEKPKCPPPERVVNGMPINYQHCQMMPNMPGCAEFIKAYELCRPKRKTLKVEEILEFPAEAPGMEAQAKLGYCTGDTRVDSKGQTHRYYRLVIAESTGQTPGRAKESGRYKFLYSYLDQYQKDHQGRPTDRLCASSPVYNYKEIAHRPIHSPNLYFHKGEVAHIEVDNRSQEKVTIHWHGILLENKMDGVPYVTQAPIGPGEKLRYEFELKQDGTYWYHPHTALHEQHLRGALTVFPSSSEPEILFEDDKTRYHHDRVLLLSDFKKEDPNKTRNRMIMGMEQYIYDSKNNIDLLSAIRKDRKRGFFDFFKNLASMGMPNMDRADVWYDAFFINDSQCLNCGQLRPFRIVEGTYPSDKSYQFKQGERIRLRVINGSGSSYFYVNYANAMNLGYQPGVTDSELTKWMENQKLPMLIVAKDGRPIEPLGVDEILIGMGETYDVIVEIVEENKAYEFLVKSYDDIRSERLTRVLLGADTNNPNTHLVHARNTPVYLWGRGVDDGIYTHASYFDMKTITDFEPPRDRKGNIPSVAYFNYRLHMDMENGKSQILVNKKLDRLTNSNSGLKRDAHGMEYVVIPKGKRIRMNYQNTMIEGMMNHPIHLHGNFFRVLPFDSSDPTKELNPLEIYQGAELHTANVFPDQDLSFEFYVRSDEEEAEALRAGAPPTHGCWMVHCHNLYHMSNSMMMYVKTEGSVCPAHERDQSNGGNSSHAGGHGPEKNSAQSAQGAEEGSYWALNDPIVQFNVGAGVSNRGHSQSAGFNSAVSNGNQGHLYVRGVVEYLTPAFESNSGVLSEWSSEGEIKYCFSNGRCVYLSIDGSREQRKGPNTYEVNAYVGGTYRNYSNPILSLFVFQGGVGAAQLKNESGQTKTGVALNLQANLSLPVLPNTHAQMSVGCRGMYCSELFVETKAHNRSINPYIELVPTVGYSTEHKAYGMFQVRFHFEPISLGSGGH